MGRKPGQGKFEGGRKALPEHEKRVNVTVKLPQWLIDWLRVQAASQGRIIEDALIKEYRLMPPVE